MKRPRPPLFRAVPGRLVSIYTSPSAGDAVIARSVVSIGPAGLEGDRYAAGAGSFSRWPAPHRAVTLIAQESIDAAEAAFGVSMQRGEHRRNLVVEGVPLEDLRGVRLEIGDAVLEGVRLCAPCRYLVRVTGQAAAFDALVGRGGLRARVVEPGRVRVGDAVAVRAAERPRRSLPG